MSQALLMLGLEKVVVGRPTVVDHHTGIVEAKEALGRLARTCRVDDIRGGVGADEGVQPGFLAADVPAGLVQHGPGRLSDGLADGLVDWCGTPPGPQDNVGAAAAAEADAEDSVEEAADLAVGHAALLVEFDDGRLGIGAELSGGGSQGIGSLQGVAALHAAATLPAAADVNVELTVDRPTRDLDLVLMVDVRLVDGTAAVGAGVGQRRLVGFVDLLGRLAMGLGAVVLARLAAGLLRLRLGRPLGEGRRLAFPRPALFVEQASQVFDLSAEFGDEALQISDLAFEA